MPWNEFLCPRELDSVSEEDLLFEFLLISQEKIDALRVLGADVRPVPAVAFDNPQNYNHQVSHLTRLLPCMHWNSPSHEVM